MKYSVTWHAKRTRKPTTVENLTLAQAQCLGADHLKDSAVVTIGQACEAADVTPTAYHIDNVGKYFLHLILK